MKRIFYILICIFLIISEDILSKDDGQLNLIGKTFVGRPVKEESGPGCEGCGEPGYIKFEDSRRFEMAWPGSDEIDSGTYSQKGQKIYLRIGDARKPHLFMLSKDGVQLVCREMHFILRDIKNPWKK